MENNPEGIRESFVKYLTFSEEDENLGMVCTDAGYTEIKPYSPYPPNKSAHPSQFREVVEGRTLPEFQMVYISRGEGVFVVEGATYKVIPGSFLFIFPGVKHHYRPDSEIGWDEYWVGFKGDFFSRLIEKGILSREHTYLEIGLHTQIFSTFNRIFQEILIQQPLYQIKACSEILSLITEIVTHERRRKQPNHYQKTVEKAKYLIESNLYKNNDMNISAISELIGVSVSRLNEIFKVYTSMTPYQYCIQLKINEAKMLLENENLSVKEVAHNLGFEDQGHFSKLFKNKTGIAPSDWKKFLYQ
jgi:AraC-like DNA-binding protein